MDQFSWTLGKAIGHHLALVALFGLRDRNSVLDDKVCRRRDEAAGHQLMKAVDGAGPAALIRESSPRLHARLRCHIGAG
jgi:hypothetical protein